MAGLLSPGDLADPAVRQEKASDSGSLFQVVPSPNTARLPSLWRFHLVGAAEHRNSLRSDFVRNNPDFVRYFQQVIYSDEMMFHTILGNSPFRPETGNHYLHFMKWGSDPHPAILTEADVPALRASEKCFARKFDDGVDAGILDAIDREFLDSND